MRGFTIIELLLVIATLALLSFLSVPVSLNFYRSQLVATSQNELLDALTRAQYNAKLQKADSRYGVYIDTNSFILYKGSVYGEDPSYDEVYIQPDVLSFSTSGSTAIQTNDINFLKLTGLTSATGTITITHTNGESGEVIIDEFGNAYVQ